MTTPLVVAEIGAAHNGEFYRAQRLIDEAARAGADAVKFQAWWQIALPGHVIADGPWAGRDLVELYDKCAMPWAWFESLFAHARALGLTAFASAFDHESVDMLDALDCPMFKIASAEIVDLPLIRYAASKGKPLIISTGMATWDEINDAVEAAHGADSITLLKCTSAYPASAKDANLRTMLNLPRGAKYGLSDHTLGSAVAVAATALGATMIEKHIGLDRTGPDGGFCTLPDEFASMVRDVRTAAAAMGPPGMAWSGPLPSESSTLALRRSLWVIRNVRKGDAVSVENVRSLRPAGGMPPGALEALLGETFKRDVAAGSAFVAGMVEGGPQGVVPASLDAH